MQTSVTLDASVFVPVAQRSDAVDGDCDGASRFHGADPHRRATADDVARVQRHVPRECPHDLRRLEDQARVPMFNEHPIELGLSGNETLALDRLRAVERYREMFADLTRDSDDNFNRLFGEAFADAYEKQMQKLLRGG